MVNKEAFAKRLEELMNYYEISAAGLADRIGVQRSSISHLLSGRNNPSLDFIIKILDNYPQTSFDWLVKGSGTLSSSTMSEPTTSLLDDNVDDKNLGNKTKEAQALQHLKAKQEKSIDKVLLFYADGSFEVYDKPWE